MDFRRKLQTVTGGKPGLCIGLDPVLERLPEHIREEATPFLVFNREIIEHTHDIAAAYKPNIAFYEAAGTKGWSQLEKTIREIPGECLVIVDAKRGDIGSTAVAYASALFDGLNSDAVTVSPYLGGDSIEPFLQSADKGAYILTLTTNTGGSDLQELVCDGEKLYRHVIKMVSRLNRLGNAGLVVGATKPDLWGDILELAEDLPLLIPGIGAQGGNIEALKTALRNYNAPALVNASRSIIYASQGKDFGRVAREAALRLRDQLQT